MQRISRKGTVEDSYALSAHQLIVGAGLAAGGSSLVVWVGDDRGACPAERLVAESTTPRFGGKRWWWRCSCGRRVTALFLPLTGATRFKCRHCHCLTYRSVQQHDSRVDFYRSHPEAALEALRDPLLGVGRLFLILRSVRLIGERGGVRAAKVPDLTVGQKSMPIPLV